ncbi:MAG: 2-dehydropantoate 2-reductase [Methanomassiliicoccales archaeon]|nr:2-dehydropantoate 2-reductase [Methanomassiliicoccales archaeon]
MRIVVFGAGALGSVVGGLLTRRHQVTLIGREAHMRATEESGLSIGGVVEGVFLPNVATELDGSMEADAVIVTVKARDLETALASVRPLLDKGTQLVVMQNGLSLLRTVAKRPEGTLIGVTSLGAMYASPGKVVYAGEGDTYFGSLKGGEEAAKEIAETFSSVGLDSFVSKDIVRDVWMKAVVNASANPLTAVARCRNAELLKNEHLALLWRDLCLEAAAVARGCGIDIQPEEALDRTEGILRKTAANKSSMLQDVERGKRTEIEEITGEIVKSAREKGIEAKMNLTMLLLVESIDNRLAGP